MTIGCTHRMPCSIWHPSASRLAVVHQGIQAADNRLIDVRTAIKVKGMFTGAGKSMVNVAALDDAVAAFNPTERRAGKTVIRVRP